MKFLDLMPLEAYSMPSSSFVPNDSHVMVINKDRDMEWDDFGGGWSDPRPKTLEARTNAYKQWLLNFCKPTSSPTDTGIIFLTNGVCHNAANRVLLISDDDVSVRMAPKNEYVQFFFGKYGMGLSDFKQLVINAYNTTARDYFIPRYLLDKVLSKIDNCMLEELRSWKYIAEIEGGLDVGKILDKAPEGGYNEAARRMCNFIQARESMYSQYKNDPGLRTKLGMLILEHAESYLNYLSSIAYISTSERNDSVQKLKNFLSRYVASLNNAHVLWQSNRLVL